MQTFLVVIPGLQRKHPYHRPCDAVAWGLPVRPRVMRQGAHCSWCQCKSWPNGCTHKHNHSTSERDIIMLRQQLIFLHSDWPAFVVTYRYSWFSDNAPSIWSGKCHHHWWGDAAVQCLLSGQCHLYRGTAGKRCQAAVRDMPALAHTRSFQQRYCSRTAIAGYVCHTDSCHVTVRFWNTLAVILVCFPPSILRWDYWMRFWMRVPW